MLVDDGDHIQVRQSLLEQRFDELSRRMDMQYQATQDLVEAWQSARTMLAFIQFLAKVGTAVGVVYLFVKGIVRFQ